MLLSIAVPLVGCQTPFTDSGHQLVVENEDDLPHVIDFEIHKQWRNDGPNGEEEIERGQISIEEESTEEISDVFEKPYRYTVVAKISGSEQVRIPYGRKAADIADYVPYIRVKKAGYVTAGMRRRN